MRSLHFRRQEVDVAEESNDRDGKTPASDRARRSPHGNDFTPMTALRPIGRVLPAFLSPPSGALAIAPLSSPLKKGHEKGEGYRGSGSWRCRDAGLARSQSPFSPFLDGLLGPATPTESPSRRRIPSGPPATAGETRHAAPTAGNTGAARCPSPTRAAPLFTGNRSAARRSPAGDLRVADPQPAAFGVPPQPRQQRLDSFPHLGRPPLFACHSLVILVHTWTSSLNRQTLAIAGITSSGTVME